MSETETFSGVETQPEPDPIEVIYQGECESLSGRSTLTYAVGRHPDGTLHTRIVGNSASGMYCPDWLPGADIDTIVIGGLTAFRNGEIDIFTALPEQYVELLKDADLLKRTQHFEMSRPTSGQIVQSASSRRRRSHVGK